MKSSKGKGPANGVPKTSKKLQQTSSGKVSSKDPVEVYCRVRPLREDESASCVEVVSNTILQLKPPECSLAFKAGHQNATMHTFKHVLGPETYQETVFDRVGMPLVEDLLSGKNGVLFAYGITNSGKTYTINGEPEHAGVLPRSLDVIFNSIVDVQTPRYVFHPDGGNSYNVFTEEEANIEQRRNKPKKISPRMRAEQPDYGDLLRIPERRKIEGVVDEDSGYGVFASFVEIYNKHAYDLLDDSPIDPIKPKPPTALDLRQDPSKNMYVYGANEVEIKSTEEAFEVLCRGQKKRRVALTQLNQESSRSHSVFTIRLVQAPLDHSGKEVLQDKNKVTSSQLCLVDLAGSERCGRTNASGERLKEAGNINTELLTLRNCMETLRDNQINSKKEPTRVPYRNSKLTQLFMNYFDGEGKVRMVVCVSPREEDYDETLHVMRFAEVTQEVVVDRSERKRIDTGLAPGRKKAYLLYKAAMREAAAQLPSSGGSSPDQPPAPHPYMLALGVLSIQKYLSEECSVGSLSEFKAALEQREKVRLQLIGDLTKKQSTFRENLVAMETDSDTLHKTVDDLKQQARVKDKTCLEVKRLKGIITAQDEKIVQLTAELERATDSRLNAERECLVASERLSRVSQEKAYLMKTTEVYEADKRELEQELCAERHDKEKREMETEAIRSTMQGFVSAEKQKFEKLACKMKTREKDLAIKNEKLRQVEALIKNSPCVVGKATARYPLRDKNESHSCDEASSVNTAGTVGTAGTAGTTASAIPVRGKAAGTGRKRSFSENCWLEHKPSSNVTSGDLLQPVIKKKKTVTTPKPKHLRSCANRYCLEHQEEDSEGDLKTELYKGQIYKTRGGGHSIQFTDVEILKHNHPHQSGKEKAFRPPTPKNRLPRRSTRLVTKAKGGAGFRRGVPRIGSTISSSSSDSSGSSLESSMEDQWTDVETRCAVAVEGRPGGAQPALVHMSPKQLAK